MSGAASYGAEIRPLVLLLLFSAAFYVGTRIALHVAGVRAALPLTFIPFLLLLCLPIAVISVAGMAMLAARPTSPRPGLAWRTACGIAGLGLTYFLHSPLLWAAMAAGLLVMTRKAWTPGVAGRAALLAVIMIVGYASVWNLNYLIAGLVGDRLVDASLLAFDLAVVGAIGRPIEMEGLYPLWRNPSSFRLFENAYSMLFPQVLTGLLLVSLTSSKSAARWLSVFLSAYVSGVIVFALVPAVGPPIFAPESFHEDFGQTHTAQLMRLMSNEFRQLQGGGPLSGFGYFVAIPSLHVAAAVILQATMRPWPWVYWTWMPITLLLICSTIVLGYHYLIDLPAGLLLGGLLVRALPPLAADRDVLDGAQSVNQSAQLHSVSLSGAGS